MMRRIYQTTWQIDGTRLGALRREVFVVEQNVPEELEWDEFDAIAVHFACEDDVGKAIKGTARLVVDSGANKAIIGRLCVARPFRHQKIATQLMLQVIDHCRGQGYALIELHAQVYLQKFYEGLGFVAHGNAYMEAGIEHITMVQQLGNFACR